MTLDFLNHYCLYFRQNVLHDIIIDVVFLIWEFPVIHYLVLTSSLEKPNQAFVLFLFNQIIPILGRPIFLAFTKLTYRVLYLYSIVKRLFLRECVSTGAEGARTRTRTMDTQ